MNSDKILYLGSRLSQVLGCKAWAQKNSKIHKKAVFYPAFRSESELADRISRVKWYMPKTTVEIVVSVKGSLNSVDPMSLATPEHHREPLAFGDRPKVVVIPNSELATQLKDADIICVWKISDESKMLFYKFPFRVRIIDPDFYLYSESHTNAALLWYDLMSWKERKLLTSESLEVLTHLFKKVQSFDTAYLFGTGPSIDEAHKHTFDDGVRIICNTMVANDELLERLKPQVVVFTDSAFHFGVSKYCERFADDLVKVVKRFGAYCVTNQVGYALMYTHYPELRKHLIGVPALRFGGPKMLTPTHFSTRDYKYTILTRLMIPLAAGLAEKIVLLGFDGRKPDEDYFWKHNPTTQYNNEMQDVWETHKAFFRDTNYSEHYEGHCMVLAKMLDAFEKQGRSFEVLGNSYVPALKKRMPLSFR